MIIELLAWSGALLSSLLSVPQLVQALRSRRLDGVSAATYWLVLGNALVWASWAILVEQYAAGVPALVNGPAAILILVRLHGRSDQRVGIRPECGSAGPSREPNPGTAISRPTRAERPVPSAVDEPRAACR